MLWIRLFLSCLLFESAAGSLAWAVILCRKKLWGEKDYFFALAVRKAALLLYAVPVTFVWVCMSRIHHSFRWNVVVGDFIKGTVPGMRRFFGILFILWLGGLGVMAFRYIRKGLMVSRTLRNGRRECRKKYEPIILEYQERFSKTGFVVYENEAVCSPISIQQDGKEMILLPVRDYTEKELRMILEHELNHIAAEDIYWRWYCLMTICVHWFNPVLYRQFQDLICCQEIVCDLRSSMEKPWFTKKEYAMLLASQSAPDLELPPTSGFAEKKKEVLTRIEVMAKVKPPGHMKKRMAAVGCACLLGFSLLPSMAFASAAAGLQEMWMHAEEPLNWKPIPVVQYGSSENGAAETPASDTGIPYRCTNHYAETVDGNTRAVFRTAQMLAGDVIGISAECGNAENTYRIGIECMDTGSLTFLEGQGHLHYVFEIKTEGAYAAYIENCGDVPVRAEGFMYYSDCDLYRR